MNKLIEIDGLKKEIQEMQKMYMELLNKIDRIKIKLQEEKVSKKDIINIIDGDKEWNYTVVMTIINYIMVTC